MLDYHRSRLDELAEYNTDITTLDKAVGYRLGVYAQVDSTSGPQALQATLDLEKRFEALCKEIEGSRFSIVFEAERDRLYTFKRRKASSCLQRYQPSKQRHVDL